MDAVRQEMIEMRRAVLREVDTNQVRMHLFVCGGGEGACVCVCAGIAREMHTHTDTQYLRRAG